ncbi:cytochrome P450 [Guyanagaster necrorhizus]|uniref:sterol 22-desaturase n=1 Tax=Guyanagaster necrorhizus TaxID=856835 RepID=A0A9P8AW11_9AGAR|nr:cytochrome P450 [Guyanagaster necrorhizus MCA 3950]KAG7450139.1 cytochrome P450 [Guyanagaster necrorhizus MCA 3950]
MALNDSSRSASIPSSSSGASHYAFPSVFAFSSSPSATWLVTTTVILASLLILEQSVYRYKKRHLPGDKWTIPIIGKFADSMKPTMEGYMKQWNSGALSAISVFNIFIVMASSTEYARKILNSPTYAEPCLVHSAKQVLLPDNWVFLTGKEHVDYRRSLNALFTRKAIGMYIAIQDVITRKHFKDWLAEAAKDPSPKPIMMTARHLNMDTSLRVFCGNYIPEHATREISEKYWAITLALELVNFPLALPGTKIYRAIQSRKVAMYWLELAAASSKVAMARGGEPACLLDEWVRILQDPSWKGRRDFSNLEMAMVIFSFLFASQDAMSSGLIYGFQHLADRPDILAKVREEQERVRQGNYDAPLTIEMMDEMPYLQAFVKESMRIKPPVTMVPYKTTKAFPIASDYTVPAGSMIIPSFYNALHDPEVFPDPDVLQPERWLDPQSSANANPKNYLVFGAGPHKCIGLEYAMMNIALVLGTAAVMFDWEHDVTPKSEQVEIIATLFPKDGCRLKLTPHTYA